MEWPTIQPDAANLLSEQERLDQLRQQAVQRHGARLCDLAYANPFDGPPVEVLQAMHNALNSRRLLTLQYTPYGGATTTRRTVAQNLVVETGLAFRWPNVILTPGAMAAINVVFRLLRHEGDTNEIIVITPCWLDYPLYLCNLGIEAKFVSVRRSDYHLDIDAIGAAISSKTRAIILSQPANPTGIVYTRAELMQLSQVLEQHTHGIYIISDECHRDFTFGGPLPCSPAQCYVRCFIIYSFGKRLLIQGQRIGYVAVSPNMPNHAEVATALVRLCRIMGFCTPTALMQVAIRQLIGKSIDYSVLAARRIALVDALRDAGYDLPDADATFFVYPRTPHIADFEFVKNLADRGVLALPATVFHSSGNLRLSVSSNDQQIERAIGVLRELR